MVTDVLWYWLFVKSVFKTKHLTGICSVVYFHPFAFSPRFGWASGEVWRKASTGTLLGSCRDFRPFKVMSWEPTETSQLPRLAGRFFHLIITPSWYWGRREGDLNSCLFHSPLKITEVSKWVDFDFWYICGSSAEQSEHACDWGWSHTAPCWIPSLSASSFSCLLHPLLGSLPCAALLADL